MMKLSPLELPGRPNSRVPNDESAAAAAASLGWAKTKLLGHVPGPPVISRSASVAAQRAAAILSPALKADGPSPIVPVPKTAKNHDWVNAAANQAFLSHSPQKVFFPDSEISPQQPHPLRPRSVSSPADRALLARSGPVASSNALRAATVAHRPHNGPRNSDRGSTSVVVLPRNLPAGNTPGQMNPDEQRNANIRRASALAMACTRHTHQQKVLDVVAERYPVDGGSPVLSEYDDESRSGAPINLQEAAFRMAQERLKKLHQELQKNREFEGHYGSATTPSAHRRFPLPLPEKFRRMSLNTTEVESRPQRMSLFPSQTLAVDEGKREKDNRAVLEAARKNVKSLLRDIDNKVQANKGRVPISQQSEWEFKAQVAAQTNYELRTEHHGQLDIGGGMFMSSSEVEAIARKRLQPLLAGIDEKVRMEKAQQEALRAEQESKQLELERQRSKDREDKTVERKAKDRVLRPADHSRLRSSSSPEVDMVPVGGPFEDEASSSSKVMSWLKSRLAIRKPSAESPAEPIAAVSAVTASEAVATGDHDAVDGSLAPATVAVSLAVENPSSTPIPGRVDNLSGREADQAGVAAGRTAILTPPPVTADGAGVVMNGSPRRDSRFQEMIE